VRRGEGRKSSVLQVSYTLLYEEEEGIKKKKGEENGNILVRKSNAELERTFFFAMALYFMTRSRFRESEKTIVSCPTYPGRRISRLFE